MRQPLAHFLLAGVALTAAARFSAAVPARISTPPMDNRIVLQPGDLTRIRQAATQRLRRPPATQDMPALIEDAVRTEILAREAVRLGLDRDDPIIRARLAEKLDFLAEDISQVEPTPEDLAGWIASHAELYAAPSRVAFQQVAFTFAAFGEAARERAAAALTLPDAGSLADTSGLRFDYADFTPQQVIPLFGPEFAAALFALPVMPRWQGPLRSALGWHVVRVAALAPAALPDRAQVAAAARADWIDYQRVEARRRFYRDLRARYRVVLPASVGP